MANAPESGGPPLQRDATGKFIKPLEPTPAATPAAPATPPPPPAPTPPQAATPAQPAAPPPGPKHPAWLSKLAETVGFTPEQIERLDTNALGEGVSVMQARVAQQPAQAPPAAPAAPPPQAPPPPDFDLGLTDDQKEEFGPELMGVLTKIGQAAEQKAAALEQRLAQYEHREVQRTQSQMINAVDMAIASLPAEYQAIIGAGPGLETMTTAPKAHERRLFVLQALERADPSVWNKSPAEIQARIKEKMADHWGITAAAPAKPVVTRDQWDRGGSPPPTQRTGHDNLPPLEGRKPTDRFQEQLTEEELEDEHILASLRRRKQPQPAT